MAQLGINDTVDTISAEHLGQLRRALAAIGEALPDSVMIRIADTIHAAAMQTWSACEAETRDVVPEETL